MTECVSFRARANGKYPIRLSVYDQLWHDDKLMRVEDFLTSEGYPNESHASNDFFFYAANCQCVPDVTSFADVSASFYDDLWSVKASAPGLFDALAAAIPGARLGVASFIDKPISPMGGPDDYVFRIEPGGALTGDRDAFLSTV